MPRGLVAAHRTDQTPHRRQRLAARVFDGREHLAQDPRVGGAPAGDMAYGLHLDHDRGHLMGHGVVQVAGEREPFLLPDQLSGAFPLDVVEAQHQAAGEGQGQFQRKVFGEDAGVRVPQQWDGEHADTQGRHDHRSHPGRTAAHRHGEEDEQARGLAAAAVAGRHVHRQQLVGHRGHEGAGAGHQRGPRDPSGITARASRAIAPASAPEKTGTQSPTKASLSRAGSKTIRARTSASTE